MILQIVHIWLTFQTDGTTKVEVLATAKYQEPDSRPSSPASGRSHGGGDSASEDESVVEG